jgi:hypothetical protein
MAPLFVWATVPITENRMTAMIAIVRMNVFLPGSTRLNVTTGTEKGFAFSGISLEQRRNLSIAIQRPDERILL